MYRMHATMFLCVKQLKYKVKDLNAQYNYQEK